jgi:hypothetical protein
MAFFRTTKAAVHFYLPVNCGFRFSRNARVPTRMSSVDAIKPNKVASNTHFGKRILSPG